MVEIAPVKVAEKSAVPVARALVAELVACRMPEKQEVEEESVEKLVETTEKPAAAAEVEVELPE